MSFTYDHIILNQVEIITGATIEFTPSNPKDIMTWGLWNTSTGATTSNEITSAISTAQSYTDTASSTTLASAQSYTDTASSTTLASAQSYTDNQIQTLGLVQYKGTWDSTNSSSLKLSNSTSTGYSAPSSTNNGWYYLINVPSFGITTLNGISDWNNGDWVVSNGSVWQKIDNNSDSTTKTGNIIRNSTNYSTLTTASISLPTTANTVFFTEITVIGKYIDHSSGLTDMATYKFKSFFANNASSTFALKSNDMSYFKTNNTTGAWNISIGVGETNSNVVITVTDPLSESSNIGDQVIWKYIMDVITN